MRTESQAITYGTTRRWVKWLIMTLVLAVIAFLASPNGPLGTFWRPSAEVPHPAGVQLPLLVLLNMAEVVTFGLGVSFLIFGYSLVQSALPGSKGVTLAAYLSIGWLLASWWPHDSLHVANGLRLNGLIAIEYGFHITLMVAGAILAYFFLTLLRQPAMQSR